MNRYSDLEFKIELTKLNESVELCLTTFQVFKLYFGLNKKSKEND